jgi:hypothetical protein
MRLWISLDEEARARLQELARQERRRPRDQAAILLERILATENDTPRQPQNQCGHRGETLSKEARICAEN